MRTLIIDDKADHGWKQLLKALFPLPNMKIKSATDIDSASKKLSEKYDIIFLDVRLERKDHFHRDVEEYSGFKILERIKNDFLNPNFSTPIILITASNKIWNINTFMDYGVDAFYIKEHPNNVFNKETTKSNYNKLKGDFNRLIELGPIRTKIWNYSKGIMENLNNHKYFNNNSGYKNVKDRIIDKIKLGYYYRFKGQHSLEQDVLKADNQSIAFIIYFSILEEIVKGFTDKNTWDKMSQFTGNWKFRNNEYFIYQEDDGFEVNPVWNKKKGEYSTEKYNLDTFTGQVNLSDQVYALIYHYRIDTTYKESFKKLNFFRNQLSYTHSSIRAIYKEPLVNPSVKQEFDSNSLKMLKLINEILKHPK